MPDEKAQAAALPEIRTDCLERFLRYVRVDTRSDPESQTYPSTDCQWDLLRLLRGELEAIGLEEVVLDDKGYLTATLPATSQRKTPVIGLLAHVDTSPEASGKDVEPILHRDYDGRTLTLPEADDIALSPATDPALAEQRGHDIVTASGSTLLGADDKAGVAEIMAAMAFLVKHPEIAHGKIRVAFTPDEEIGKGTDFFDVEAFGATYAYTLDGGGRGALEVESFSADTALLTFHGFNTHPGYAKGVMLNSIKVAADFLARLPSGELSPETTEGYEGYVHPYVVDGSVETTTVRCLVRDFDTQKLALHEKLLEEHAKAAVAAHPGSRFTMEIEESYRNLSEILVQHPKVVDLAREAIERAGVEVRTEPIRGGTDGCRLTFRGLPTPNIFAGGHNFHSRQEWVAVQDMEKAVEVIVHLCRLWEERGSGD